MREGWKGQTLFPRGLREFVEGVRFESILLLSLEIVE